MVFPSVRLVTPTEVCLGSNANPIRPSNKSRLIRLSYKTIKVFVHPQFISFFNWYPFRNNTCNNFNIKGQQIFFYYLEIPLLIQWQKNRSSFRATQKGISNINLKNEAILRLLFYYFVGPPLPE